MSKTALRYAARLLPGIALVTLAVPANAQVVNASYSSMSKSEAILGGAPSALAAIRAQQSGQPAAAPNRAIAPASPGALSRPAVMP